jgi:hypothetical protein
VFSGVLVIGPVEIHGHSEMSPCWRPLLAELATTVPVMWVAVALLAIGSGPAARQSEEMRGAVEDIEPIVIEAHEQLVTDQPRRHGVEDLA